MIADAYDLHTAFFFLAGTIVFANVLIMFMPDGEAKKPATAAERKTSKIFGAPWSPVTLIQ